MSLFFGVKKGQRIAPPVDKVPGVSALKGHPELMRRLADDLQVGVSAVDFGRQGAKRKQKVVIRNPRVVTVVTKRGRKIIMVQGEGPSGKKVSRILANKPAGRASRKRSVRRVSRKRSKVSRKRSRSVRRVSRKRSVRRVSRKRSGCGC